MIEPQKHDELDQLILEGKPAPESYVDAIRMRFTTYVTMALLLYIFFRVIF